MWIASTQPAIKCNRQSLFVDCRIRYKWFVNRNIHDWVAQMLFGAPDKTHTQSKDKVSCPQSKLHTIKSIAHCKRFKLDKLHLCERFWISRFARWRCVVCVTPCHDAHCLGVFVAMMFSICFVFTFVTFASSASNICYLLFRIIYACRDGIINEHTNWSLKMISFACLVFTTCVLRW